MKSNMLKFLTIVGVVTLFFSSCIKNKDIALTDQGATFVKVLEAPENKIFFAPFKDVKTVDLFSLRKDANSSSALNTATNVKATLVPGYITRYNAAHGSAFEVLPDSLFTTTVAKAGSVYDLSLASGQSGREFTIRLNGAKWNLEKTYALAFYLSDVNGLAISKGKDTIMAMLSVINAWDGVYEVTGDMTDVTNATLKGPYPMIYHLVTASTTSVIGFDPYFSGNHVPIWSGITSGNPNSLYGSFCPIFEFDPATNKIISVINSYGQPAGNTRSAQLDPSGENMYFSDTRTIKVKFWLRQPSVVTAAPNIRVIFDWTMSYKGLR